MTTNFWSFPILCKDCGKPTSLQSFQFCASGELRFITYCHSCKSVSSFSISMERLKQIAFYHDIEDCLTASKKKTADDEQFLRELHITREET